MSEKMGCIPVEEAAKQWFTNPEFVAAYDALEEEFARAEARISARLLSDEESREFP